MQIRIALPSKGRISEPAVKLLGKAGIGVKDTANRRLFSETYDDEISVMFTRAADIPEFVADGAADIGMTGLDLIEENSASVEILEDLNFGSAKLVLAVPDDSPIDKLGDIADSAFKRVNRDSTFYWSSRYHCRSNQYRHHFKNESSQDHRYNP